VQKSSSRRSETKGDRTRRKIVERAAVLFNSRGVAGASMADVSAATGLEKGGVYNHFATKEELALAAFDYAAGLIHEALEGAVARPVRPLDKLMAIVDVYRRASEKPFIAGGCPLLNAAVEADDTSPPMRARVRRAMDRWRGLVASILRDAVAAGDLPPCDVDAVTDSTIATLEGGVMLGKLYGNRVHLQRAADHVADYVTLLAASAR
jgi:TetR/AcrR family transcriptional repressor of nem operon